MASGKLASADPSRGAFRARAVLVLAIALLAGCSGDALQVIDAGGTARVDPSVAIVTATATPSDAGRFDPFSGQDITARPLREVIANPTLAQVMEQGPLPEFSLGRADAPVTLVKYASLTCPFCRRFQAEVFPALKREYIDTGRVRFVMREFPIGKTSGMATIALRCVPMASYLPLYERFLAQQAKWVSQEVRLEPILDVAKGVGLTAAQFDSCRQNQGMIDGLKRVKDRGRELGIIGTPNFFINNRLVKKTLGLKELRELIDPLLAGLSR